MVFLSLLPVRLRWKLLWSLPIADVCRLEETSFFEGMAMEEFWSTLCHSGTMEKDTAEKYANELGKARFTKAYCYSQVAHVIVHKCNDLYIFTGQHPKRLPTNKEIVFPVLYAIRKFTALKKRPEIDWCDFVYPSRYSKYSLEERDAVVTSEQEIKAAIECFNGYPQFLCASSSKIYKDDPEVMCHFLHNLSYLQLSGITWEGRYIGYY